MPDITVTTDENGIATFKVNNGNAQQWALERAFDWEILNHKTEFRTDIRVAEYVVEQAKYEGLHVEVIA